MKSSKEYKTEKAEIFAKACSFCAYQERTQQEVRDKLYKQKINGDLIEEIITQLIQDNFLNEERFAKAFAGGKFRIKRWGRLKIEQALKVKGLSPYCIRQGLKEIDEEDYKQTIRYLTQKKTAELPETNTIERKDKIYKFLARKGYEPHLIWEIMDEE